MPPQGNADAPTSRVLSPNRKASLTRRTRLCSSTEPDLGAPCTCVTEEDNTDFYWYYNYCNSSYAYPYALTTSINICFLACMQNHINVCAMQPHQLFTCNYNTLVTNTYYAIHTITTYIDFLHCNHTCTHNICSPCSNASAIFMQLYHNMQRHYVTSIIVLAMCHLHISYFSPCISCCSVFCRHACTSHGKRHI